MSDDRNRLSLAGYLLQIVVAHSFRGITRVRPGVRETIYVLVAVAIVGFTVAVLVSAVGSHCTKFSYSAKC